MAKLFYVDADKIKTAMSKLTLTQKEAAWNAGVSLNSIQRLIQQQGVTKNTVVTICRTLGVEMDEISDHPVIKAQITATTANIIVKNAREVIAKEGANESSVLEYACVSADVFRAWGNPGYGSVPRKNYVRRLANALGVDYEWLVTPHDEPKEEPQEEQPAEDAGGYALVNLDELKASIEARVRQECQRETIKAVQQDVREAVRQKICAFIEMLSSQIESKRKDEMACKEIGNRNGAMNAMTTRRELEREIQTVKEFALFAGIEV